MGWKGSSAVNAALRASWPELFGSSDGGEFEFDVEGVEVAIADFLGLVRAFESAIKPQDTAMPPHIIIARAISDKQAYDDALKTRAALLEQDPSLFIPFPRLPIVLWGQFKEALGRICRRILHNLPITDLVLCCDFLGMTPRAKTIVYKEKRYVKPSNSVHRQEDGAIFADDLPIYNNFYDIFADKTSAARRQLLVYLTRYFTEEFAHVGDNLPPGKRIIYHGGISEDGKLHELPIVVSKKEVTLPDGRTTYVVEKNTYIANPPLFRGEADLCINSWVLHYPVTTNIMILSKDGDLLLSSLSLTRDRWRECGSLDSVGRIIIRRFKQVKRPLYENEDSGSGDEQEEEEEQPVPAGKRKRVVKKKDYRWEWIPEYIDVNGLFSNLWALLYKAQQLDKVDEEDMCDPIELFTMLCFMCGNDYVDGLPGVSFVSLFKSVTEHIGDCMPVLRSKLSATLAEGLSERHRVRTFRIDYANFIRMVVGAYQKRFGLPDDPTDELLLYGNIDENDQVEVAERMLKSLRDLLIQTKCKTEHMQKQAPHAPIEFRQYVAALSRTVNYYTQGGKAGYTLPDDMAVDSKGASVHGYTLNKSTGEVERATDVAARKVY
jgi:hypothetical protein